MNTVCFAAMVDSATAGKSKMHFIIFFYSQQVQLTKEKTVKHTKVQKNYNSSRQ